MGGVDFGVAHGADLLPHNSYQSLLGIAQDRDRLISGYKML